MNRIALKMLVGDRAKYLGIIMGITFASLLITQQASIFVGLMTRTYGFITDTPLPDLWVMDPKVQFVDDIKPLQETALFRVRGITGVEWAVPLFKGLLKARLENGVFQTIHVVGVDDATLIGGPTEMIEGNLSDLRRSDGVIVDIAGATGKLAKPPSIAGGKPTPLKIGDSLEINDHRAIVVGICRVTRTFQSQPMIYTTYSRAITFAPSERKHLSFILVHSKKTESVPALAERIRKVTGLSVYPSDDFIRLTLTYFIKNTGIPINFGIAVILGFIVGTAIAGQTFYNFIHENMKQFATLKAMGVTHGTLLQMILLQALLVGSVGYGLGVGLATLFGRAVRGSELAFRMPWQLLVVSAGAVSIICLFVSFMSAWMVLRLEPAIVFKS